MLDLKVLEQKLDKALAEETIETLNNYIISKRTRDILELDTYDLFQVREIIGDRIQVLQELQTIIQNTLDTNYNGNQE